MSRGYVTVGGSAQCHACVSDRTNTEGGFGERLVSPDRDWRGGNVRSDAVARFGQRSHESASSDSRVQISMPRSMTLAPSSSTVKS